jgi:putative exosortase-associated protein (TIGR04073 family)
MLMYRSTTSRFAARGVVLAALFALVLAPTAASADTAARKCGRGLANMVVGVLAIPGEIVKETRASSPARGFTVGFAMGLGMLVVRELVGVYEFISSPFPIPEGFKPIIEPEFPWDYFDES